MSEECRSRTQGPHHIRDQMEEKQKAYCDENRSKMHLIVRTVTRKSDANLKEYNKKTLKRTLCFQNQDRRAHKACTPNIRDYSMLVGSTPSQVRNPAADKVRPINSVTTSCGVFWLKVWAAYSGVSLSLRSVSTDGTLTKLAKKFWLPTESLLTLLKSWRLAYCRSPASLCISGAIKVIPRP
jgi:hypothetical protein